VQYSFLETARVMIMSKITNRNFFTQPAELLAPALLGKIICRKSADDKGKFTIRYRITATEAYPDGDKACDGADSQKLSGGHLYVTKKGMHGGCRFDIVANIKGKAEGVLISGVDCFDGPGKAAEALDIDARLDGVDLATSGEIWIEDDGAEVVQEAPAPRKIGETHDDETKNKPLKFIAKQITYK
jgi:DNA-3-methyladenine glycosylase